MREPPFSPEIEAARQEIENLGNPADHPTYLDSGCCAHAFKIGEYVLRLPHYDDLAPKLVAEATQSRIEALSVTKQTPYFETLIASRGLYVVTKFIHGHPPYQLDKIGFTQWVQADAQQQLVDRCLTAYKLGVNLDTSMNNAIVTPPPKPQLHMIDYHTPRHQPQRNAHPYAADLTLAYSLATQIDESNSPEMWRPIIDTIADVATESGMILSSQSLEIFSKLKRKVRGVIQ